MGFAEHFGLSDSSYFEIFLLECVKATDCPYGGINYQCVENLCKCPSTMELVDKLCKGMLKFM